MALEMAGNPIYVSMRESEDGDLIYAGLVYGLR
jgi:hypothetical protein